MMTHGREELSKKEEEEEDGLKLQGTLETIKTW